MVQQPPRQTLFFRMIRAGKAPIVGDGGNLAFDELHRQSLPGPSPGRDDPERRRPDLRARRPTPLLDERIIDTVERLLDTEFGRPCATSASSASPVLAASIASVLDAAIQGSGFYNQKLHVLSEMNKTIACSIAKAQKEAGLPPRHRVEEGMRRSLAWCLSHGLEI